MYRYLCYVLLYTISAVPAFAEESPFITWQTANIQVLKGQDYELGQEERAIITFEYANSWRYGDFFMFADGTRYDDGGTTAYTELSPRISFSKVTGKDISAGIFSDILLAGTYEEGKGSTQAFLYGIGTNVSLPGFTFFQANAYLRDNPNIDDDTWQLTFAWMRPFAVKNLNFVFEGFADIAGDAGNTYHENQLIVPRVLLDIGEHAGVTPGKLWLGMEYSYWRNKFGIDGVTESLPQLQIKWVF